MKKTSKVWIIALVAIMAMAFASCESPEEQAAKEAEEAAKAAAEATASLITTLGGTDAAAIAEALKTAGPTALVALTSTSGAPGGDFSYRLDDEEDGIEIYKYSGAGGAVIVPAEIEGYPVSFVDGFYRSYIDYYGKYEEGYDGLITSVVLPDSVEEIFIYAFREQENLHTINLPLNIKTIYADAFQNCANLYNLIIPESIQKIDWDVSPEKVNDPFYYKQFNGCGKLPLATHKRLQDLGYKGQF